MHQTQIQADPPVLTVRIVTVQKIDEATYYGIELSTIRQLSAGASQPVVWRVHHRFSEVAALHEQLKKKYSAHLPSFQSRWTAGIQGKLFPQDRIEFLQVFLSELFARKTLRQIIEEPLTLEFLDLKKNFDRRKLILDQLALHSDVASTVDGPPANTRQASGDSISTQRQASNEASLEDYSSIQEPDRISDRVEHFLTRLKQLHQTRDKMLAYWVFNKFEFLQIDQYKEDHIRRLLFGNQAVSQVGLLQFCAQDLYRAEIVKFLSEAMDVCKNKNFDSFQRVFTKVLPKDLRNCQLGSLLETKASRQHVVQLLQVYFEYRGHKSEKQMQDIQTIFPMVLDRQLFCDLLEETKTRKFSRQLDITKQKSSALRQSYSQSNLMMASTRSLTSQKSKNKIVVRSERNPSSKRGTLQRFFTTDARSQPTTPQKSDPYQPEASYGSIEDPPLSRKSKSIKLVAHNFDSLSPQFATEVPNQDVSGKEVDDVNEEKNRQIERLLDEISALNAKYASFPTKEVRESRDLHMYPERFRPDTLYLINLFTELGQSLICFFDKIDTLLKTNKISTIEQFKLTDTKLRLLEQLAPELQLIEITAKERSQTYLHYFQRKDGKVLMMLLQYDSERDQGSLSEKMVIILSQELGKSLPRTLNPVMERPNEEDKGSASLEAFKAGPHSRGSDVYGTPDKGQSGPGGQVNDRPIQLLLRVRQSENRILKTVDMLSAVLLSGWY